MQVDELGVLLSFDGLQYPDSCEMVLDGKTYQRGANKILVFFHTDYHERYIIPNDYASKAVISRDMRDARVVHKVGDLRSPPAGTIGPSKLKYTFRDYRCHWRESGIPMDDGAIDGHGFQLILMTMVTNQDGQVCTKLEGTTGNLSYTPEMLKVGNGIIYKDTAWVSPPLGEYYPDVLPVKGYIEWLEIGFESIPQKEEEAHHYHHHHHHHLDTAAAGAGAVGPSKKGNRPRDIARLSKILVKDKMEAQDNVKDFILQDLLPFFRKAGESLREESANHFRMMYPITMDNVGIYNAYMSYMIHVQSRELGPQKIHYLFQCALARTPEIGGMDVWMAILDVRFAVPDKKFIPLDTILDISTHKHGKFLSGKLRWVLERVDNDFNYLLVKALTVAIDVLTIYNNAVPYLSDQEHIPDDSAYNGGKKMKSFQERWAIQRGQRNGTTTNTSNEVFAGTHFPSYRSDDKEYSPHNKTSQNPAHTSSYHCNYVSVERFFSPTAGFGQDCEDGATYALYLKCVIQREYYRSSSSSSSLTPNGGDETASIDPLIAYLGRVYELFNACVMGIYTHTGGEEVFHICTFMIPRWYMYQTKQRGQYHYRDTWKTIRGGVNASHGEVYDGDGGDVIDDWVPSVPNGVALWEKDRGYYGSFVAESTCVEEPHKFPIGPIGDAHRRRYKENYATVIEAINNGGVRAGQSGMINRVLLDQKDYFMRDETKLSSFYLIANMFDHIDDGDNLKKNLLPGELGVMFNVFAPPEKSSFVWFTPTHAVSIAKRKSKLRAYGVTCQSLFLRDENVGCYPLSAFATLRGRKAFEASMVQMNHNWPPMAPTNPPIDPLKLPVDNPNSEHNWPVHIKKFYTMLKNNKDTGTWIRASIDQLSKTGATKYLRMHILDTEIQSTSFQGAILKTIQELMASAKDYYALKIDIKYIQDSAFYPSCGDYSSTHHPSIVQSHLLSHGQASNGKYHVSIKPKPLYQVLLFFYYKK
jgi:hypothetical protein